MWERKYFLWNIWYFTFSSRARLFHWKEKVYILLGSTLLNTFWQAAEYFRRKIENEITEKDFVTEENRNQPINRNQSMWMRRNRVDISEEYRVPKCIWIKALGWVYPISNDVEFTIFSILNSFRFTSKLKSGFLDFSKTCQFTSGMYRSRGRALIANSIHDFWGEENQTIESLFEKIWDQFDINFPVEHFGRSQNHLILVNLGLLKFCLSLLLEGDDDEGDEDVDEEEGEDNEEDDVEDGHLCSEKCSGSDVLKCGSHWVLQNPDSALYQKIKILWWPVAKPL